MQHIASIVHGNNFMILLPLAELYDLEIFLRGGRKPEADTRYDYEIYNFDMTFPQLRVEGNLQRALLRELFEIAKALKWLHEELHIPGSLNHYLAHLDLKPENILISRDSHAHALEPRNLAGKWMLTDFGVSVFDKATDKKNSLVQSVGDAGHKVTSRVHKDQTVRGHGPYQPPEVDLERVDSTKCDVWSFACIMCDVLAFASGRAAALREFRSVCFDGKNDFFYRARGNLVAPATVIDSSNTELKREIRCWYQNLAARATHSWVSDYVKVLERALVPESFARLSMGNIMTELDSILSGIGTVGTPAGMNQVQVPASQSPSLSINFADDHLSIPNGVNVPPGVTHMDPHTLADPAPFELPAPILPRRPTPEYQENHSKNSSTTEVPDQQRADVAAECPPSRLRPASGQPLPLAIPVPHLSPTHPNIKAPSYEQIPKITIPLDGKDSVNAIAVTPSGDKVAYLCGDQIHAYWADNGLKAGTIDKLLPQVVWEKMCVTSTFALIYGLKLQEKFVSSQCDTRKPWTRIAKQMQIQVHDFSGGRDVENVSSLRHSEQASNILLSSRNVAACVYKRWVRLWSLASVNWNSRIFALFATRN